MTTTTARDVLNYVPNWIGYARVILTLTSFGLMMIAPDQWLLAISLYLASFVGDLFDGMAARALKQMSSFGGVLDMMTDRCSTLGLLYILAGEYAEIDAGLPVPAFRLTFLALMILDVASHWTQMYCSLSVGQHHKSDEGNVNRHFLVRWFYGYYWFFGYLCCGAEFTWIGLYLARHVTPATLPAKALNVLLAVCLPGCIAKQAVNVAQLTSSCHAIAQYDAESKNKGDKHR